MDSHRKRWRKDPIEYWLLIYSMFWFLTGLVIGEWGDTWLKKSLIILFASIVSAVVESYVLGRNLHNVLQDNHP